MFSSSDINKIKNIDSKNNFELVLQSYYSKNFKSCILLLYNLVVNDLYSKLVLMDDNNYVNCRSELETIENILKEGYESKYSIVEEKIFEARFQIVPELVKMGASIVNQDSFALIEGVRRLSGAKVQARELRGGAGLIMAALAAEGETVMEGMEYVRRGYEDIKGDLKSLGIVIY